MGGFSAAMSALWLPRNSIVGQPWAACQARLGASIAAAIGAASHGHGVASQRRCDVSTRPTATPMPSTRIVYLVSSPIPKATPTANHSRGEPPRASNRATRYRQTAHRSSSNVTVWSIELPPRNMGEQSTSSAART
jgi:hypothetical protein